MGIFSKKKRSIVTNVVVEEVWPFDAENGFVIIDFETTGLSPISDRVIEIGMIRTDSSGNPLGYWSTLINPKQPVGAIEIHGIHDTDVANAPTFDGIAEEIMRRIRGQVLVAHNASFDMSFLRAEFARAGWDIPESPTICTMEESTSFIPGLSRRRLSDCIEAIGINQSVTHRALGDASLTTALFNFYLNGPTNPQRSVHLKKTPQFSSGLAWPVEKTFPPITPSVPKRVMRQNGDSISEVLMAVSEIMPEDLLNESFTRNEISYCQLLLDSLADGRVSEAEIHALSECANSFGIADEKRLDIHKLLLDALSREAWKDGVVSRSEKREISETALALGLSEGDASNALNQIEEMRVARISQRTTALPDGWQLGEPLRIGDRVVITGCYEQGRTELETKAKRLGIRITGSVSGKTTFLVSDGTINGNKDADAARLQIRTVSPDQFRELLSFVQPPLEQTSDPSKSDKTRDDRGSERTESLVCTNCAETFTRVIGRGRKPHLCTSCRPTS
jgi:DNA polymerase-3 subunit epsilon